MKSAKSLSLFLIVLFTRIRATDLSTEYYSKLNGTDEPNSCEEIKATRSLVYLNTRTVIQCALACQYHPWCVSIRFSRKEVEQNKCKLFNDFPSSYDVCTSYFKEPSFILNISSSGRNDIMNNKEPVAVEVLGRQTVMIKNRGINTMEFDTIIGKLSNRKSFDTYFSPSQADKFAYYLKNTKPGTIIVGQTYDDPRKELGIALPYLKSVGLDVANVPFRGKFAFVWQKGFVEKTIVMTNNNTKPFYIVVKLAGHKLRVQFSLVDSS